MSRQGGRQIDTAVNCDAMEREGFRKMELLSASASEKDGKTTITLANLHMTQAQQVKLTAVGGALKGKASVSVLRHDDVHACNTFEDPTAVTPSRYEIKLTGQDTIEVPPACVMAIIV